MDNKWEMYKTLGVPVGATSEQIKEAYHRLAKEYHPDITKNMRDGEKFAKIVHAYKVLSVHTQRKSVIDFPTGKTAQAKTAQSRTGNTGPAKAGSTRSKAPKAGPSVDVFSLGKLLAGGKTVGMRAFAARALGNSSKKSAYAFLRKGLYDTDPLVVKSSIEAIGKLKVAQCSGELGATFFRGANDVKIAVLEAIEAIGCKPQFKSIIMNALRESDHEVRRYALRLYLAFKKEKEANAL